MRAAAQNAFWALTESLEGYDDSMYVDILDLVTCGVGDLVDPLPMALGLPWLHRSDDSPASVADISKEWGTVKTQRIPSVRLCGGNPRPLYLKPEAVQALVEHRRDLNETLLAKRWGNWSQWPADAQLGGHAIAWAAGASWHAPHFDAAAAQLNFMIIAGMPGDPVASPVCRGEAWLRDTGNPGLRCRNLIVKKLFQNAARSISLGLDPDVLQWPTVVAAP
jgi:hypothetical protein